MRSGGKVIGCHYAELPAAGGTGRLRTSPDDRTAEYLLPSESELHLVEINQCCTMQKNEGMKFLSMCLNNFTVEKGIILYHSSD